MTELVQGRPVPFDGLVIGLGPRNLNEIMDGAVEGAIAADAEVGAGRGDQCLGVRQDEPVGNRCGSARQFARQVFALVGVEHRESFQKRDRIGLVSSRSARRRSSSGTKRSAETTAVPCSPWRTWPRGPSAWRKVS